MPELHDFGDRFVQRLLEQRTADGAESLLARRQRRLRRRLLVFVYIVYSLHNGVNHYYAATYG